MPGEQLPLLILKHLSVVSELWHPFVQRHMETGDNKLRICPGGIRSVVGDIEPALDRNPESMPVIVEAPLMSAVELLGTWPRKYAWIAATYRMREHKCGLYYNVDLERPQGAVLLLHTGGDSIVTAMERIYMRRSKSWENVVRKVRSIEQGDYRAIARTAETLARAPEIGVIFLLSGQVDFEFRQSKSSDRLQRARDFPRCVLDMVEHENEDMTEGIPGTVLLTRWYDIEHHEDTLRRFADCGDPRKLGAWLR